MKTAFNLLFSFGILITILACNKHEVDSPAKSQVIANAGEPATMEIAFNPGNCNPANNSFLLDGSKSTAVTGSILAYYWTYLQNHPRNTGGLVQIENQNTPKTTVLVTSPGEFWFSLRVFDEKGGSTVDSVKIVVTTDTVNGTKTRILQPLKVGEMKAMVPASIVSVNQKVIVKYYVNAMSGEYFLESNDMFKMYDLDSKTWTELPVATDRRGINMVSVGNKLVLSGGSIGMQYYDKVDILDVNTGQWTALAMPANFTIFNSVVEGNKIFFTGKDKTDPNTDLSDRVEILDMATNTWTSTKMSQKRSFCIMVPAGDLVYFASNPVSLPNSNVVDVYHITTNTWSRATTESNFIGTRGVAFGNKVYFYSGYVNGYDNGDVQVWDPKTGESENICMGDGYVTIYPYDGQLLFFKRFGSDWDNWYTKSELYKYDPATEKWTVGLMANSELMGGVGTTINQSGHSRIFGVGSTSYPDSHIDFAFSNSLPDYTFWDIEF